MPRYHQALASGKSSPHNVCWPAGAFLLQRTRSESNSFSARCSSNPMTTEHVETVSWGWKQWGTYRDCPRAGLRAHPSTSPSCTLTFWKDPSCLWFHLVSEESRDARKNCVHQEPRLQLPKILPFPRARFFFLSSFCGLLLTFKCMAFFPLEIVWLLMVHSKKVLPQGLAFAFNFGVSRCKKLWSLVTVRCLVLFWEPHLGEQEPHSGQDWGCALSSWHLPASWFGPLHQQPLTKYLKSFLDALFYFSSQSGSPPSPPTHPVFETLQSLFSIFNEYCGTSILVSAQSSFLWNREP